MPLTQQSLLQSLTSVPTPLVCMEVCVPLIQQDLLAVSLTQQLFLAEFDQCASSPCMHGGVCASHPTGPVCILCLTLNNLLAEFDQCASSPCMHGGVCASHPTGPVCNCTGTGYGGKYCHTSKF